MMFGCNFYLVPHTLIQGHNEVVSKSLDHLTDVWIANQKFNLDKYLLIS